MFQHLPDVQADPNHPQFGRHNLGAMDQLCRHCGARHFIQERVNNSSRANPQFGSCCLHGKVSLPALREPPEPLHSLYTGDNQQARSFRTRIRGYNCALQLASTSLTERGNQHHGDEQQHQQPEGGISALHVNGRLYHRLGPVHPDPGSSRQFAQMWIYDTDYDRDQVCACWACADYS